MALPDWLEVARLAKAAIDEMERGLHEMPGSKLEFILRRADAQQLLGKALLCQEKAAEAVPILRQALKDMRDAKGKIFYMNEWNLRSLADEDLPEALTRAGETPELQDVLEASLTERKAELAKQPGDRSLCTAVAHLSIRLAEALDPAIAEQAARRRLVLDRAAELFSGPDAEAQISAGDRELKIKIEALRAATPLAGK